MSGLWIGFIGGLLTDVALGGEEGLGSKVYYKIGIHSLSFQSLDTYLENSGEYPIMKILFPFQYLHFINTCYSGGVTYMLFSFFFIPI